MTDKEIIKELEYQVKYGAGNPKALDLINRQQEKIEHIQGEREILLEDMQVRNNQVIEQQAEIERLQRLLEQEEKSKNSLTKKCYKDA